MRSFQKLILRVILNNSADRVRVFTDSMPSSVYAPVHTRLPVVLQTIIISTLKGSFTTEASALD